MYSAIMATESIGSVRKVKNPRNLFIPRGREHWYVNAIVNGRRICRSTFETDKSRAIHVRNRLLAAARAERWGALEQTKAGGGKPNLSLLRDLINTFRAAAAVHGLRDRTVDHYVWSLCRILAVQEDSSAPCSALTSDAVNAWIHKFLLDNLNSDRARRSAKSILRQAKSVFARWTRDKYSALVLPDLRGFLEAGAMRVDEQPYDVPLKHPELCASTPTEGRKLRETNRRLYVAFVLCYDVGMRASEAAAARWTWIQPHDGVPSMWIIQRPEEGFRPKGRARAVALDDATLRDLQELRSGDDPFILPGGNPSAREDVIKRKLATWMRSIGWRADLFPKAAHELRKLRGSYWFQNYGPAVAQLWLGHQSLNTTCKYYATFLKQPKPLPRA